jgi:Tol biopolymer transport system component
MLASCTSSDGRRLVPKPLTGKIVFAQEGIYVMNADGSELRKLTDLPGDMSPSWSPDGTQIAFERELGDQQDVYVMDANGKNVRRLTTNGRSGEPSWSPSGDRIVFRRDFAGDHRRTNRIRLFVINPDGSGVHRATKGSTLVFETSPSWSPDGKRLVFVGYRSRLGSGRVYTVKPGGYPTSVAAPKNRFLDPDPAWSPIGRSLLLVIGGYRGGSLSTMTPIGANLRPLKGGSGLVSDPAWAPDGKAIVFARGPEHPSSQLEFGRTRLYTLALDGREPRPLTPRGMTGARDPSWWSQ